LDGTQSVRVKNMNSMILRMRPAVGLLLSIVNGWHGEGCFREELEKESIVGAFFDGRQVRGESGFDAPRKVDLR
jgi:hypothetical protein